MRKTLTPCPEESRLPRPLGLGRWETRSDRLRKPVQSLAAARVRGAMELASTRILFFLHSLGYLRFFDAVIRRLLDRGHTVHLLVERDNHEPNELAWLEDMKGISGVLGQRHALAR